MRDAEREESIQSTGDRIKKLTVKKNADVSGRELADWSKLLPLTLRVAYQPRGRRDDVFRRDAVPLVKVCL